MSELEQDLIRSAKAVARALSHHGYLADFSPASLAEIDRFFDENVTAGKAHPNGLLSTEVGARLFGLGGYVGEVIRLANDGEWICDDNDPHGETNVQLCIRGEVVCFPVQRVMKRFRTGPEEGIAVWAAGLGAIARKA